MKKKIISILLAILMISISAGDVLAYGLSNDTNNKLIVENNSLYSYPVDKLNGFKVVKGPQITNKRYKTTAEKKAATIVLETGFGALLNGITGYSVSAIKATAYLTGQDYFERIGGVYTKSYYVRKITNPKNQNVNVPVPYQYAFVTFVYRSSSMSDSTLEKVIWQYDGGPRLARN